MLPMLIGVVSEPECMRITYLFRACNCREERPSVLNVMPCQVEGNDDQWWSYFAGLSLICPVEQSYLHTAAALSLQGHRL